MSLIRAGFFIGIGIGLAYLLMSALFLTAALIVAPLIKIWEWMLDISPGTPWAGPVIALFFTIALGTLIIYLLPVLKDQWIILRNKTR
ncbi:MAG: hypothetical protein KTR33_02480 [Gammaproteobacteria bacterium]|nr:hypothetical protein [Gammaproteobacteria bacterium]